MKPSCLFNIKYLLFFLFLSSCIIDSLYKVSRCFFLSAIRIILLRSLSTDVILFPMLFSNLARTLLRMLLGVKFYFLMFIILINRTWASKNSLGPASISVSRSQGIRLLWWIRKHTAFGTAILSSSARTVLASKLTIHHLSNGYNSPIGFLIPNARKGSNPLFAGQSPVCMLLI